jgi:hypothetical protein
MMRAPMKEEGVVGARRVRVWDVIGGCPERTVHSNAPALTWPDVVELELRVLDPRQEALLQLGVCGRERAGGEAAEEGAR